MAEKLIRRREMLERTGLKNSTAYKLMSEGKLPRPVSLGSPRAVAWKESEITDWIESRPRVTEEAV